MPLMFCRFTLPGTRKYDCVLGMDRDATPEDVTVVSVKGTEGCLTLFNGKLWISVSWYALRVADSRSVRVATTPELEGIWADIQHGMSPGVLFDFLQDVQSGRQERGEDADPQVEEVLQLWGDVLPGLEAYALEYLHAPGNWADPAARRQLDNVPRRS